MRAGLTLATLGLVLLLGFVRADDEEPDDCVPSKTEGDPNKLPPPCGRGMAEAYLLKWSRPGYVPYNKRICCPKKSKWLKIYRHDATGCKTTDCGTGDLCSTLPHKEVNGSRVVHEEIMRDRCTTSEGGKGFSALCCMKNSDEGVLMTTLGAELNEFPHQAKLILNGGHCGGTIYNERWIVTAAHCIVDKYTHKLNDASGMVAILGTNNGDLADESYKYKVVRAIPHEEYSKLEGHPALQEESPGTFNDIALLELERDIEFSDKIKALEIADKDFDPFKYATNAVIAGWGTTETLELSAHLQKANFILRKDEICRDQAWYSRVEGHEDSMLCVGGVLEGKWSYTAGGGDSGGPAICRNKNGKAVLCGVTSFGGDDEKCAKNNDAASCPPSVYTEVAHFHDWIVKYAGEQNSEQLYRPTLYGQDVPKGKYDYHVRITSATGKSCGGTLINANHVLTAAQCVMKSDREGHAGVKVTTGINDLKGNGKTFGVKGVVPLQDFKRAGKPIDVKAQGHHVYITDNYYKNDLALLKLDGSVNIQKFPKLPEVGESYTEGVELAFPRNTTFGGQMRSRKFKILEPKDCQGRMDRLAHTNVGKIRVDKDMMCGVERYSGGSQCDRELGGGLICKGNVLCGIQIFRLCDLTIPNGFLNLGYYGSWVKAAIDAAKQF